MDNINTVYRFYKLVIYIFFSHMIDSVKCQAQNHLFNSFISNCSCFMHELKTLYSELPLPIFTHMNNPMRYVWFSQWMAQRNWLKMDSLYMRKKPSSTYHRSIITSMKNNLITPCYRQNWGWQCLLCGDNCLNSEWNEMKK